VSSTSLPTGMVHSCQVDLVLGSRGMPRSYDDDSGSSRSRYSDVCLSFRRVKVEKTPFEFRRKAPPNALIYNDSDRFKLVSTMQHLRTSSNAYRNHERGPSFSMNHHCHLVFEVPTQGGDPWQSDINRHRSEKIEQGEAERKGEPL